MKENVLTNEDWKNENNNSQMSTKMRDNIELPTKYMYENKESRLTE